MVPRVDVWDTEAQDELSHDWHARYIEYLLNQTPVKVYMVKDILQGEALRRAKYAFRKTRAVLSSRIFVYENMPDYMTATIREDSLQPSGWHIAINGRIWIDPADLVFVIGEEAVHIAQKILQRPIDNSLPYPQRPHEITAKKGAKYIAGGRTVQYSMQLVR